jgi:hypothetical protein
MEHPSDAEQAHSAREWDTKVQGHMRPILSKQETRRDPVSVDPLQLGQSRSCATNQLMLMIGEAGRPGKLSGIPVVQHGPANWRGQHM